MSPFRFFLIVTALLATTSCDDHRTTKEIPTPTTITVVPSLGMISHGQVALQQLSGAWNASGSTGTTGHVSFTIPAGTAGPFLVTVCGDTGSSYFDEALGMAVEFSASDCLRALLPDDSRPQVGVTLLTEAAVRRLEALRPLATVSVADIEQAHAYVRGHLLPEIPDLLQAPALVNSMHELEQLPNDAAGQHSLKLAALAGAAAALAAERSASSRPALDLVQPLADDLADGKLDGLAGDIYIVSSVYDIHHIERLLAEQLRLLGTRSEALSAILATLADTPFLVGIAPASGGDTLLSWQGVFEGRWSNVEKFPGARITSPSELSNFESQLVNGAACRISIHNNFVTISGMAFSFPFATASAPDESGLRRFSLSRHDNMLMSFFSLSTIAGEITSSISLTMQDQQLISAHVSGYAKALAIDYQGGGTCLIETP